MGIAGAGNSGTLLATLFAPRLAERFGWASDVRVCDAAGRCACSWSFALMAQGQPEAARRRRRCATTARVLRERDTFWLAFLYSLTFGGFVGLASFLTTFFHEQYQLSRVAAGDFTTIVVVAGSLLRPVGGWLADRFGGYRLLVALLAGVCRLPRRRGRGAAGRARPWCCSSSAWACSAWATARCSSWCRSAFPSASAS